jgi:hypothetical protein
MTLAQFSDMLDRYGGDFRRWPAALRAEAEALAAEDPEAAATLSAAVRLDRSLADLARPIPLSSAEIGGLLARAGGTTDAPAFRLTGRLATVSAAVLAICLAAGFAAGLAVAPENSDMALAALIFGGGDVEGGLL